MQAYNMRSERSLFASNPFGNRKLNLAVLATLLLMAAVIFTPIGIAFGVILLPAHLYLYALGLVFVPLVFMELSKAISRLLAKRS